MTWQRSSRSRRRVSLCACFGNRDRQVRTGTAPRTLASFRNLGSTFRLAGRANIAHARRDLLNHNDAFAVYGI
ncbi:MULTISPECIES: hypothetical protein [unclassified Streptomyces]|uniref:hypothetical protein n=1 Tax=unclassified Streptomyces TaxID=2593676 RepID=UPI003D928993